MENKKVVPIGGGGSNTESITVDNALSAESLNPVQNKVIKAALDTKADKATTLAGYGITDAYTKSEIDKRIEDVIAGGEVDLTNYFTKEETNEVVSSAVSNKADKSTSLAGYGITDAYTKSEVSEMVVDLTETVDANYVTLGTNQTITGEKIFATINENEEITVAELDEDLGWMVAGYTNEGAALSRGIYGSQGVIVFKDANNITFYGHDGIYIQKSDVECAITTDGDGVLINGSLIRTGNNEEEFNKLGIQAKLDAKADKATTLSGYGITNAYTKTEVDNKVAGIVNSAPETLDTLKELATALGNDPNFATTVSSQIGKKANTSDLSKVATSGSYNDLSEKPIIPSIPSSLPANGGNADTVNGHSVLSDVPANAEFTDTKYELPTANRSTLGGVKLSDAVDDTSGVNGGIAATPASVKSAYDLAKAKQSPATTLEGYGIEDAYTKDEVNGLIEENNQDCLKTTGGVLNGTTAIIGSGIVGTVFEADESNNPVAITSNKNAEKIGSAIISSEEIVISCQNEQNDNFNMLSISDNSTEFLHSGSFQIMRHDNGYNLEMLMDGGAIYFGTKGVLEGAYLLMEEANHAIQTHKGYVVSKVNGYASDSEGNVEIPVATSTKGGTMSPVDKAKLDGINPADYATETQLTDGLAGKANKKEGVYYIEGTGDTAGTWLGFNSDITEYYPGLSIAYKPSVAGATGLTLNINGLGAVPVVRNVNSAVTTHYGVNSIVMLTYTVDDGTAYWKLADYDSDTKTRSSNLANKKMFIIGAQSQSTSGQTTYSNNKCYIGTDNCLYSNGSKVALASEVTNKADTATTLSGYGITDAYTKTEVDGLVANSGGGGDMPFVINEDGLLCISVEV